MAGFNDTTIEKEVRYNRATKDYDCYVAGRYVGSERKHDTAETLCNTVAYDLIADGQCYTATELDGGQPDEVPAVTCVQRDVDWIEYQVGDVLLSIEDDRPACLTAIGTCCELNEADCAELRSLYILLSDPRVQQHLGIRAPLAQAA